MTGISIVGLGKLGAPLLAVLASRGFDVHGIDLNSETVARIGRGVAPVEEPRLQELLTAHKGRIHATTDWQAAIRDSEATFVLVPTPSGADGAFENGHVIAAVERIGLALREKAAYHLVVVNSTVMPGSTGGPIRRRLEASAAKRVGHDLGLCYNPEFVALGTVVHDLLNPEFVLIGESDERAGTTLEGIWRQVVGAEAPIARMNFVNAELTKVAVNAFVTMKISFANTLSEVCDNLEEADVDVVTAALGHDTRIGSRYLRGATGYGGPCFPRDTKAFARMAKRLGVEANLATATHDVNARQLERIKRILGRHTGPHDRLAVLGLAYKPGTPVTEQAQGLMLAASLRNAGHLVIVHDPMALDTARSMLGPEFEYAASVADAVAAADAVVVMTPAAEYREFFATWPGTGPARLIVDCWRLIDPALGSTSLRIMPLGINQRGGGARDQDDRDAERE
jgi:UDPglucose 6-dehydrogenase